MKEKSQHTKIQTTLFIAFNIAFEVLSEHFLNRDVTYIIKNLRWKYLFIDPALHRSCQDDQNQRGESREKRFANRDELQKS